MIITGSNHSIIKKFYKNLFNIRSVETKIINEYPSSLIRCPVHLSIGQEGVASAVAFACKKNDYFISNHRGHAHYLAKDCSVFKMFSELLGKKTGCSSGNGGSMHLIDKSKNFIGTTAIVSNSIPVGVGYAEAFKLKKKKSKVIIFLGDAATEEGVFYECINYVALKKLPVVFIVENNEFSVYTHLVKRQPKARKLNKFIKHMGLQSYFLDEENPFFLHNKINKIFKKNNTPLLINIPTFRYYEHCGVNNDDHLNYRKASFIKKWKRKDPIEVMRSFLIKNKILNKLQIDSLEKKINQSNNFLFNKALKQKFPTKIIT